MDYWRGCSACGAHILVPDTRSQYVYCNKCRSKLPEFEVTVGGLVYVQPYVAEYPWNRSQWIVLARDGDALTLQVLGNPEMRVETTVAHVGDHRILRKLGPG